MIQQEEKNVIEQFYQFGCVSVCPHVHCTYARFNVVIVIVYSFFLRSVNISVNTHTLSSHFKRYVSVCAPFFNVTLELHSTATLNAEAQSVQTAATEATA